MSDTVSSAACARVPNAVSAAWRRPSKRLA